MRAREVDLDRIDPGPLHPLDELHPIVSVILLHDRGDQDPVGELVLEALEVVELECFFFFFEGEKNRGEGRRGRKKLEKLKRKSPSSFFQLLLTIVSNGRSEISSMFSQPMSSPLIRDLI